MAAQPGSGQAGAANILRPSAVRLMHLVPSIADVFSLLSCRTSLTVQRLLHGNKYHTLSPLPNISFLTQNKNQIKIKHDIFYTARDS